MMLNKKTASQLEALYRRRVEWIKKNIKNPVGYVQTCGYCSVIGPGRSFIRLKDCPKCPAYDHAQGTDCDYNDLSLTRSYFIHHTEQAKVHLKTTYRFYRQWRKRYGNLLKGQTNG